MFIKDQKVIYLPHDIEATVFDSGETLTSIIVFDLKYNGGTPSILTIDNNELMDIDTYISNKRDKKINDIINGT